MNNSNSEQVVLQNTHLYNKNGSIWYGFSENDSMDYNFSGLDYSDDSGGGSFFDTYFSKERFIVETVMAILSFLANFLALLSTANTRNQRYSIYHILFINLCVCNALSLSLSWISNNALFLFSHSFTEMMARGTGLCQVCHNVFHSVLNNVWQYITIYLLFIYLFTIYIRQVPVELSLG